MTIVIPRSTWEPNYANGCDVIGTEEWEDANRELWLHHSITNPPGPDATLEEDCEHVRAFEAIGEARFGCGISYTWVVLPSGRVFQGHDVDRQGTHTYGRNNRSRAICLAGNYEVDELPTRMSNAVALLLRELGTTLDGGHRDVYPTACPGEHAYDEIPSMNTLATSGEPIENGGSGGGGAPEELIDLSGFNGYALEVTSGPLTVEHDGYKVDVGSAWLFDATSQTLDFYDAESLRTACANAKVLHIGVAGERVKNLLVRLAA